jgi:hypothetical protein
MVVAYQLPCEVIENGVSYIGEALISVELVMSDSKITDLNLKSIIQIKYFGKVIENLDLTTFTINKYSVNFTIFKIDYLRIDFDSSIIEIYYTLEE